MIYDIKYIIYNIQYNTCINMYIYIYMYVKIGITSLLYPSYLPIVSTLHQWQVAEPDHLANELLAIKIIIILQEMA